MDNRISRIAVFLTLGLLLCSASFACLTAKVPEKEGQNVGGQEAAPTAEQPPKVEEKVYSVPIDATLSGKEYAFDNVKFTHIAFKADENMEWLTDAWISLNGDFLGKLYANGWEDQVKEKIMLGPGDTSVWAPIRGTWLTGENVIKVKFLTPGVGDMELPARYFKGIMYLKNDPAALEQGSGSDGTKPVTPEEDSASSG